MVERSFRILFWIALGVCFVMAVRPVIIEMPASDKLQHMAALAALTVLALLGYRSVNRLLLFAGLALFGAAIELVQGLPMVGRDSDILDWLADISAVAAVLLLAFVVRNRPTGTGGRT